MSLPFLALAFWLFPVSSANAAPLQTFKECVVGKRVSTNDGRKGTITRLDSAWSYCYVKFDDDGIETSFLFSLLNSETGPGGKTDLKVAVGTYECVTGGSATMDLRITSAATYSISDGSGKFRLDPSGRIVFESGPLNKFFSKLLPGGRIGLNTDGGSFYPTSCDLNINKH